MGGPLLGYNPRGRMVEESRDKAVTSVLADRMREHRRATLQAQHPGCVVSENRGRWTVNAPDGVVIARGTFHTIWDGETEPV